MRSKTDWLDAGLREIAASGPPGLRLEVLCAAMKATRGSFYHHFTDIGAYRQEIADYFEKIRTEKYIEAAESAPAEDALGRLAALRTAVFDDLSGQGLLLERAFRAWGTQQPYVSDVMARVDARRFDYLTTLLESAGAEHPRDHAATIYLIIVGGLHVTPPLPVERIRELVDRTLADALDLETEGSR